MRSLLFALWLLAFAGVWLWLMAAGGHWDVLADHWGIAVAMALGSYFGASTPVGGGAVGFPVLVLLFGEPAAVGRDFSFAIQSAGMVSASLYIFATRRPVAWPILGWSLAAAPVAVLGAPLGAWMVQLLPRRPTLWLVSALCVAQFVWTCVHERVTGAALALALAGVAACLLIFQAFYAQGRRLAPFNPGRPRR